VERAVADKLGVFYMGDPRYKGPGPGNNRPQAELPYGISANQGWVMPTGVLCKQPPYGGIRAIDLKTGKTVWSDTLPAGGQAAPMIYEAGGKQYVVIMAGGHHSMLTPAGDELIAYALP
jgi:quinoprotein glucose dehydrogenase